MAARASDAIRVCAYNVRFGDCVLVSFGPKDAEKHVLVDFGNAPGGVRGEGGKNDVFAPVARDLAKRTKKRLDLLVMSHEHLDHMEGFYDQRKLFDGFSVGQVFMSAMSAPDYYARFPQCEPERRARLALLETSLRWARDGRFARLPEPLRALVANNVLALANKDRVDYLRRLVPKRNVKYLARGSRLPKTALGPGVGLAVLAPERDASVYYGERGRAFFAGAAARLGRGAPLAAGRSKAATTAPPRAPRHMAPDEFAALRDEIGELVLADLLAIDKAANNTSLVLELTIGAKTLLFPGDAEAESWALMKQRRLLRPVDFLKIAHHGSGNGMPFEGAASVLDSLLKPRRKTTTLVSTCRNVYGDTRETEIPQHRLMDRLAAASRRLYVTADDAPLGEAVELEV